MEVAADQGVELALSDELFRAVGRDRALFEAGVLAGPVETRLRGRSGSLDVWFWRSRSESS
jgi:adenylate cyclase